MTVLLVRPGQAPKTVEIDGSLESMQALVGGLIQVLYPFEDDAVALICNDEGKLLGLPLNRYLRDETGRPYDVIAGSFFLCSAPADSEDFESLSEAEIIWYTEHFRQPEIFLSLDGRLICLPMEG